MFRSSAQVSVNAFALTRPVMALNSSTSRSSKATHPGEIEQFQVQSTGISNFKWTEYIGKTQRAIPTEPLRVRFRELVAPLFSQIGTRGLTIQNLRRTRDLLLPRLLSGQVTLADAAA